MARFALHRCAALFGLLLEAGCRSGCGEAPDEAPVEQVAPAGPADAQVETMPQTDDPTHAIVHHPSQLGALDLPILEQLDLALSDGDQVGHLAELPETPACDALDLRPLAQGAPRLKELRISGCADAVREGLSAFTATVTSLELSDMRLDQGIVEAVSTLGSLRELSLTRVTTPPDRLDILGRLALQSVALVDLERDSHLSSMLDLWPRSLTSVALVGDWAGHRAMITLGHAEALERLELRQTRVTNFSLHQIKALPKLRSVLLSGTTFTDATPLYLRDLPLTELGCDCPRLGDEGLRALQRSKGLQELSLARSNVTGKGLQHLAELSALEVLVLDDRDVDAPSLSFFGSLPRLRRLELSGRLLSPTMPGLGDATSLHTLRLDLPALDDRVGSELSKLENLEVLDLSGTRLSDDGLEALASLSKLRVVDLTGTRVTNRGLSHLADLSALEVLSLDRTDVVDEGIKHLAGLSSLRELRLAHTLVTDRGLEHLQRLHELRRLDLAHTVVSQRGVATLARLPNLTTVGLEGTRR